MGCLGPGADSESLVSEEEEEEELDEESVSEDEEDVSDKLLRGGAPVVILVVVVDKIESSQRKSYFETKRSTHKRFIDEDKRIIESLDKAISHELGSQPYFRLSHVTEIPSVLPNHGKKMAKFGVSTKLIITACLRGNVLRKKN